MVERKGGGRVKGRFFSSNFGREGSNLSRREKFCFVFRIGKIEFFLRDETNLKIKKKKRKKNREIDRTGFII